MATLRPTRPQTLPSLRGGGSRPASPRPQVRPAPARPQPSRPQATARPVARPQVRAQALPQVQRRVLPVALGVATLWVGLTARLFYVQIVHHDYYVAEAVKQRDKQKTLPARRGVLLDRSGNLLVQNEPACTISLDPNMWFGPAEKGDTPELRQQNTLTRLAQLLPDVDVAGKFAARGLSKGASGRFRTIEIDEQVPQGVGVMIRHAGMLGVAVDNTSHRVALDGTLAPHVVGFTGKNGSGLDGLERRLDERLTGEKGLLDAEFDHRGRPIPGTIRQEMPAQHGADTVLTLDSDLQHTTQTALAKMIAKTHADAATAVVLDPKTGDIVALANLPTYDVNQRGNTPVAARTNRAVSAPYEPGSTLKTVTIAGALEDKTVSLDSDFYCPGFKKIGKRVIHCHDGEVHKAENLSDVLCKSCNIATADIAFKMGKERLYHYMTAFGFGAKSGSGLPGEDLGLLKNYTRWSDIQTANIAFGQGISVTPLQLASAYCAIANDGILVRPRIVWGTRNDAGLMIAAKPDEGRRVVSEETARTVQNLLFNVVEQGTGKPARLDGYTAGGKTGTAQVAEGGHYGGKYVSSFIGMAPAKNPRFVVLVTITNPKGEHYGGKLAGPVFKEILETALVGRRIARDMAPRPKQALHLTSHD